MCKRNVHIVMTLYDYVLFCKLHILKNHQYLAKNTVYKKYSLCQNFSGEGFDTGCLFYNLTDLPISASPS